MLNDSETEKRLTHVEERAAKKKPKKEITPERKAAQAKWVAEKRAAAKAAKGEKPSKKGKAAKPPKEPKGAKKMARVITEAVEAGTLDAADAAKRITKRYDAYQAANGRLQKVSVECRERLVAKEAEFQAVIETAIEPHDGKAAISKLAKVTVGWQELGEVKAQNSEERSIAKEGRAKALKLFEKSIEEYKQLSLPGVAD